MDVMYWHAPRGNFGDDINKWIWDFLLPGFRSWSREVTLIGVGSLLGSELNLPVGRKLVVGTGSGYGAPPDANGADWDVRCVRGPKTAEALNMPRSLGVCDPVAMLCRHPGFALSDRSNEILFVPHWHSATHPDFDWPIICAQAGISYQSPCDDAAIVVRRIAGARLVLAESLHAAIVADAFRVPWHAVSTSAITLNVFKWTDWTDSIGVPFESHGLLDPLDQMVGRARRLLGRGSNANATRQRALPRRPDGTLSATARLKHRIRDAVLADMLRWVAQLPPKLSRPEMHARQLDRFEAVLSSVRRDYG